MKKIFIALIIAIMPISMFADSYTTMWKKVEDAQKKDLPKSELSVLQQISKKAAAEKQYGHLLKAQFMMASVETTISPDSLEKHLARLEKNCNAAKDPALKAVYASALGRIYKNRSEEIEIYDDVDEISSEDDGEDLTKSKKWYRLSLADPAMLAQHKSSEYEPALEEGIDSRIFYGDLLHVLGIEADDYTTLKEYYEKTGNRTAACVCALKTLQQQRPGMMGKRTRAHYLERVDSLLKIYSDLREAGDIAIEHYNVMEEEEDANPQKLVSYINYALANWGAWPRMNILRNALNKLQQPMFTINVGDYMMLPGKPRRLAITSIRNIQELYINVYKVNIEGNTHLNPMNSKDYAKLKPLISATPVFSTTKQYIGQPAWKENTDTVSIEPLPIGVYVIEATSSNNIKPQRELLRVSGLYLMHEPLPDKSTRYVVVNATTGEPVAGANIRITTNNNKNTAETLTTDKNGEVHYQYSRNTRRMAWAYTDDDKACGEFSGYSYYGYWSDGERVTKRMNLFTDRSLYRPGQTAHVAILAWTANKDSLSSTPDAGKEVTLILHNANGKEVGRKTVTTDSYGSASVDFVLPSNGLTGYYNINASSSDNYAYTSFHVEQYKRPTFQVTFDDYKEKYVPGDTITVRGVAKTYSGVPVQGAKVEYTIQRNAGHWWWRMGQAQKIDADTVTTADDGSFSIRIPMTFPDGARLDHAVYYNFDINAKVTDAAGETREGQTSLPLSNRTATLASDMPEKVLKDSLHTITFSYKNLLGENVEGKVNYRFDNGAWQTTDAQKETAITQKLASGRHHLEAVCGSDSLEQDIVVFSYTDKHPAAETKDWYYLSAQQFPADGSPVYLQVGSSAEATQVYWTVCSGGKVIDQGTQSLGNAVVTKIMQYKEEYGDGVTISQAWVVDGKMYSHTAQITRPVPDNKLRLTWKTFRDKLTPGQKETWTLHIAAPKNSTNIPNSSFLIPNSKNAQLLAAMYDKSLDAIYEHDWNFSNDFSFYLRDLPWRGGSDATIGLYGSQNYTSLKERSLSFTHFDDAMFDSDLSGHGIVLLSRHSNRLYGAKVMMATEAVMDAAPMVKEASAESIEERENALGMTSGSGQQDNSFSSTPSSSSSLRENLNETAFFYPSLTTDENGDVDITFTLPESVTTWRFMGLAHDSLMNYAQISAEAVASKPIMVQPNLPRFLREGDKATITTRIFNTSDRQQSGTARLIILDPETEKVLVEKKQLFKVDANGTTTASFDVDAAMLAQKANGQTIFITRILAEGTGFSDGEQNYLPLLPDKERVVNTIPFYQNEAGVKDIDLTTLFPTDSKNRKLTVEYVNNPAWLVVQALPTVANPYEKNAVSLATAIYANVIGRAILTSSPKIAQTIKLWQQETGEKTSLTSSLEKNEELKTLVLEETPWVAEAEKESDQKRQLINFLDASTIDYRINNFTEKLLNLQNSDGSFSWWPGMPGSEYMTVSVVETLVRLKAMTGYEGSNGKMIDKAFRYLAKEMAKEVAELKKLEKKGTKNLLPSDAACHWLYASAAYGRAKTSDMLYLIGLLAKNPTQQTIYGKAGAAVILAQYGYNKQAQQNLQSIREYTVYKDEMGRYFDTPKALYSWYDYRIPTQTFAIEALKLLAPDDTQTISEMQRWLLHEKRTTSWSTPVNSVNAVYAFLCKGNGSADVDTYKLQGGEPSVLRLDGEAVETPKATAGIGYVKMTTDNTSHKTLTVEKTSQGTSWGAVYGTFTQPATTVADAASGISVKREILKDGKKIKASADKSIACAVGEKITVRITVTADRDYDFVQLQDKRAACLEPVGQLSGYHWGYYCAPQDNATNYYFDRLSKGKHVVETTYYVDRAGNYTSGICTAQCAYSPEFSGREGAIQLGIRN